MPNPREQRPPSRQGPPPGRRESQLDAAAIKAHVLGAQAAQIDADAEQVAQAIVQAGLATNQVRNFYGSIAKLQSEDDPAKRERHIKMLRSRLAYLTARADGKANELWRVFDPLLRESRNQHVASLCDFSEAIVAYHKYYEWQRKKQKGGSHDDSD
jgi:CRISPR type III-A-associated protein Csm2